MSVLFFILALIGACMIYNIYFPAKKPMQILFASSILGSVVSEAAPLILLIQLLLVLLFALSGAVHGIWGTLGLAISAVSWLALLFHFRTSFNAKTVMENVLVSALGADYRKNVDIERAKYFSDKFDFTALFTPWRVDRKDVERVKDIIYDKVDDLNLRLDIYRHISKPQNCPVLLQIHGGGWTFRVGSKNEQARPLMNHMAARGWIVVSTGYRLSPLATFPEHIIDCKKAFAWIKNNIKEWGGNPDFVIVTGGSAGGHLSSLFALSANDPQFQPGFVKTDTNVQGCVPFYGVYDFSNADGLHTTPDLYRLVSRTVMKKSKKTDIEAYRQASPMYRIHKNAPPFLIIQGDSDTLAAPAEARKFAKILKDTSKNPVAYAEIKDAQHAFDIFPSVRSEYVKLGIERFANYTYDKWLKEQSMKPDKKSKRK